MLYFRFITLFCRIYKYGSKPSHICFLLHRYFSKPFLPSTAKTYFTHLVTMLYALATPNSSFKPLIRKIKNSWRLKKFKELYIEKGGLSNPPSDVSFTELTSSETSAATASSSRIRI